MSAKEQSKPDDKAGEGILATAAKAIGSAAGAVASMTGVHPDTGADGTAKASGKLEKKHKSRLPRRVKKAQKRAHNVA